MSPKLYLDSHLVNESGERPRFPDSFVALVSAFSACATDLKTKHHGGNESQRFLFSDAGFRMLHWTPTPGGVGHLKTGFNPDEKHANVGCRSCHSAQRIPRNLAPCPPAKISIAPGLD
jgi:hypothetical protein